MKLNPFARVEAIRGAAGGIDGLRIVAPVKGRGLQTTTLLRTDDATAFVERRRTVLSVLLDSQSNRDPWPALAPSDRDFLHRAGLFLEAHELPGAVGYDADLVRSSVIDRGRTQLLSADFRTQGIACEPRFMAGASLAELRRYYQALVAEGYTSSGGEGGEPNRWVLHNDALSRALHPALATQMSAIAGEPLKPSFSYLLVYLEGASLLRHRDRAQCAMTAILQVDFDPEPTGATPWPLRFARGAESFDVTLALGDLIAFRGTEIEHYREPLTCGRSSTSLAFCFVPEGFSGPLD